MVGACCRTGIGAGLTGQNGPPPWRPAAWPWY